jgi:hypothetical protein
LHFFRRQLAFFGQRLACLGTTCSFIDDTPTAKLVRLVLGAISEFDKAMTVAKLRGARERKRRDTGKCEGTKSHAERNPELVALSVNCAGVGNSMGFLATLHFLKAKREVAHTIFPFAPSKVRHGDIYLFCRRPWTPAGRRASALA